MSKFAAISSNEKSIIPCVYRNVMKTKLFTQLMEIVIFSAYFIWNKILYAPKLTIWCTKYNIGEMNQCNSKSVEHQVELYWDPAVIFTLSIASKYHAAIYMLIFIQNIVTMDQQKKHTVYPMKWAHEFVMLVLLWLYYQFWIRTTRMPAFWEYPRQPHDYLYYWFISDPKWKQDKVKVTNLKNLPKFQIFKFC